MKKRIAVADIVRTDFPGGGYTVRITTPNPEAEPTVTYDSFTTLNHARRYLGTLARRHDPSIQRVRLTALDKTWQYRWDLTD